ncbi:unnamed protein product [Brassica rapa]|uniref:Uncharacterized protein n=1 Tax=Brassica campestris TaxID=3711 RepID=A0A8D9HU20_BRACM|nr:unnamed protein product [Brassica rapa]
MRFLGPLKLNKPKAGVLHGKKQVFNDGGDTGNREGKINDLINKMNCKLLCYMYETKNQALDKNDIAILIYNEKAFAVFLDSDRAYIIMIYSLASEIILYT